MQLTITDAGKELLIGCLADGDSLTFTRVSFGDEAQEDPATATEMANPVYNSIITGVARDETNNEIVNLKLTFSNGVVASGFKIIEMGVFAHGTDGENILFAYGTEEENNADYIPAATSGLVEMDITIVIYLGDTANITITTATSAVERVSDALAEHIADTSMHGTTLEEIGAAAESHTHAATDIVSGILPVDKGGTGKGQLSAAAVLTARNGAVFELAPSKGALYSTETGAMPRFGILPVEGGGSGKNSHTTNAILTGNGTSAVKNVPTATGAAYAESNNGALKFGTLPVGEGGTGHNSHQNNAVLTGNGTGALKAVPTKAGAAYAESTNGEMKFGALPVHLGGTGGTTPAAAREKLNITPANIGAVAVSGLAAAVQTLLQEGEIKLIKSIQRGKYTGTSASVDTTVTISEVDRSKTICNLLGISYTGSLGSTSPSQGYIELTGDTALHIVAASGVSGVYPIVSWEVVEYY